MEKTEKLVLALFVLTVLCACVCTSCYPGNLSKGGKNDAREMDELSVKTTILLRLLKPSMDSNLIYFVGIGVDSRDSSERGIGSPEQLIDPSDELMKQIRRSFPAVKRYSQSSGLPGADVVDRSTGKEGIIVFVGPITWISNDEVEVKYGYFRHGLGAGGGTYRVLRQGEMWLVHGAKDAWVS